MLEYSYDIEPAMITGNVTASLWDAGNIYLDKVNPNPAVAAAAVPITVVSFLPWALPLLT